MTATTSTSMFRKPTGFSRQSTIGAAPDTAILVSSQDSTPNNPTPPTTTSVPVHSEPIDLHSSPSPSPPSAKKQKTIHFPTPSRPPKPRQTQLKGFTNTPARKFSTPGSKGSSSKGKGKNASILNFFKPVPGTPTNGVQKKEKRDARNDDLFIAHGGYGLDLSEPEDDDDVEGYGLQGGMMIDGENEDEAVEGMPVRAITGALELTRSISPRNEEEVQPLTPPDTKEGNKQDRVQSPKRVFDLSGLSKSSSMLFGARPKKPVSPPEQEQEQDKAMEEKEEEDKGEEEKVGAEEVLVAATAPPPPSTDDIEDFTQTPAGPRQQLSKRFSFAKPITHLLRTATQGVDDIECTFPDKIQATPTLIQPEPDDDENFRDDEEEQLDLDEGEMDEEEREGCYGFDPVARGIEGGFLSMDPNDFPLTLKLSDPATQMLMCSNEKEDDIRERESDVPTCPICELKLSDLSEAAANNHVNHCLDGDPLPPTSSTSTPKPSKNPAPTFTKPPTARSSNPHAPLTTVATPLKRSRNPSAFSKLMTTNTEAAAWASAAKAEIVAKGKKARDRSCPFYKILFDGPITVDAFRYGAIPNCAAYFLSHFHSDHYVGLTSRWFHGPIYCSRVTANLVRQKLRVDPQYVVELPWEEWMDVPGIPGVRVRGLDANHCPGSMLFLFEKTASGGSGAGRKRILHCGDFRAHPKHLEHPLLKPGRDGRNRIDVVYLDTTYLSPKYAFPAQQAVIAACAEVCIELNATASASAAPVSGVTKFLTPHISPALAAPPRGKLLVVVGTYSIGKERICVGLARALSSKIYASPTKTAIISALEDPDLTSLLTLRAEDAQVHMTSLMEIRAETLSEYLSQQHSSFSRVVGFRPSGWSYKSPPGRITDSSASVHDVLYADSWRSGYSARDVRAQVQRGCSNNVKCYAVPYSEHSSFRELNMFMCALDVMRCVPTVNVAREADRERMNKWIAKWKKEREKSGFFRLGKRGEGEGVW